MAGVHELKLCDSDLLVEVKLGFEFGDQMFGDIAPTLVDTKQLMPIAAMSTDHHTAPLFHMIGLFNS